MATGRLYRAILPMLLLGSSLGLAGCDPGETIDKLTDLIPNNKTPLPGTRKEVFPEGVPGVPQGVPAELVKGYQPPSDVAALPTPAGGPRAHDPQIKSAAAEPPKPKKKKVTPPPSPSQPAEDQAASSGSAPAAQAPAPWPASQPAATAPWPAPQGQAAVAPWPATPPAQRTQ
jgi:hypothetical protein